jgi:hypothetical protein
MFYLNKANESTILWYFVVALLVNIALIIKNFTIFDTEVLVKGSVIALILVAAILLFNRKSLDKIWSKQNIFVGLLVIGLVFSIIGNISVLKVSNPNLDDSPALAIIEKIKEQSPATPQVWVYEIGWPIKHMDFTYWFIKNDIHPIRAYYSQYPINTPPLYVTIGNLTYFTADYLIDTAYLENGNQNLENASFKVNNISVYQPEHILPNAFVVRNNQLIPANFEKFSPDEVILSGQFIPGDVAVLKTAYSPGWKINNADAVNAGSMIGSELRTETPRITFKFDPLDVKIGTLLSVIGIIVLFSLFIKRREIERYLMSLKRPSNEKSRKGKRSM